MSRLRLAFLALATCSVPDHRFTPLADAPTAPGMGSGAYAAPAPAGTHRVDFPDQSIVRLTALPEAGSQFVGWAGDCTGAGVCELTMDRARTVSARFARDDDPATAELAPPAAADAATAPRGAAQPLTVLTFGAGRVSATLVPAAAEPDR